jgi:hypothetical protein
VSERASGAIRRALVGSAIGRKMIREKDPNGFSGQRMKNAKTI